MSSGAVTAVSVLFFLLLAGLRGGRHREEKSARGGEGGHGRTAAEIQGEALRPGVIPRVRVPVSPHAPPCDVLRLFFLTHSPVSFPGF